jgi:catechol 2,3-dioxygenase-like lactoylglutathione lyase family enzyme
VTPRLDAIGIVVSDLQASIAFYRRLGLEFGDADEDHGHVEAVGPGGLRVMLDTEETVKSFDPDWSPPEGGQRMALAFLLDSPGEVDSLYQELVDAGHRGHKEPWDAFWGQRYAQIRDPDGNTVDLFARLA